MQTGSWDSHWLEIWSNHFCPSMGPNGGSVAMDSELFPARDSLVSDIPAGDRKIANLFYSVYNSRAGAVGCRGCYSFSILAF
jgi:hypothetical protein